MKEIDKVKKLIKESNNIVFLGGAGVSTASGIPDFRSATGLYNQENNSKYSPEYMLSYSFFREDPEEFSKYYKKNLIHKDARPNKAHYALAKLEEMGKLKAVITQNIDGLHQMAGSKNVIEVHGSLSRFYCEDCLREFDQDYVLQTKGLDRCPDCSGIIRPDIVMYEEPLDMAKQMAAIDYISKADIFIVGGTSLVVYPVAGYVNYYNGDKLVVINKDFTPRDSIADYLIQDDIASTLDYLVDFD